VATKKKEREAALAATARGYYETKQKMIDDLRTPAVAPKKKSKKKLQAARSAASIPKYLPKKK